MWLDISLKINTVMLTVLPGLDPTLFTTVACKCVCVHSSLMVLLHDSLSLDPRLTHLLHAL